MRIMAVELFVTKSRVAHVKGCVRLQHPDLTELEPWDGNPAGLRPCRSCLFPKQVSRRRPLPCPKCRQLVAMPCKHTGVYRVVRRRNGRGPQRILVYSDLAIERDWLTSLLDS